MLFKQGQVDRAITELKAATTLDPGDSGPVYVLAQAYRKKGQKAEADEMLARIAQLHSEDHNLDREERIEAAGQAGHDSAHKCKQHPDPWASGTVGIFTNRFTR